MPDPQRLWRLVSPTAFPMRQPAYMTTRGEGRLSPLHQHTAYVDAQGNGSTSISTSHYHKIKNGVILPDESDGHNHGLIRRRINQPGI